MNERKSTFSESERKIDDDDDDQIVNKQINKLKPLFGC